MGLLISLSDGDAIPASPLTTRKESESEPHNPASDLEGDLHGLDPSLEAPRLGLATGAGIGFKIRWW